IRIGSEQVCTEHAPALLFDEDLESRRRFSDATRRKPRRRLLVVGCEAEPALPAGTLVQANRGEWRNREHHAWDDAVIVSGVISLQHIAATIRPSYPATGVSRGPPFAAASPAAYTDPFDTLCRYSLTLTPWISHSTPAASSPRSSISGTRPAPCTTRSTVNARV